MTRPFERVTAFVDWNSQIYALGKTARRADPISIAERAFSETTKKIAQCLSHSYGQKNFRVSLRLYHGWHKGFEPSANCRAVRKVLAATDFGVLSSRPKIVFSDQVAFGDRLISARIERLASPLSIHLPNTLRQRSDRKGDEEKMVDTAMATDVVAASFLDPEEWILVMAEDDDLVPPLFTAELQLLARGSRALLLSHRARSQVFLNLEGMIMERQ